MTKNKNDIESLFGKLLGSANSFNSINTFNEGTKDIFKNRKFKVEDIEENLKIIENTMDKDFKEIKDRIFEKEFNKDSKIEESNSLENQVKEYNELKEEITNEISNMIKKTSDILAENEKEFAFQNITKNLNSDKLKEAVILSEILGKPVSKRKRNKNRGYR
ncbi:hypothetical protein [Clostridium tarantellae]|uniref:Uncharacterized protein n=1 Tax=Clostridium tarantellae TaxID=39493 RepID=A0A6I1MVC6_9CLOT|nr:hypothetical protein [Clostridium tarantellae]MPQ44149.1 hypothetical protein [Clostridium tarantellae]